MDSIPETKRCSKCKELKPRSEFNRNRSKKDGLQDRCRPCHRADDAASSAKHPETRRKWYEANREHVLAKTREWQKANPERRKETLAAWLERTKDHRRIKQRENYRKAAPARRAQSRRWVAENPERRRAILAAWRERQGPALKKRMREWHKANPEKVKATRQRRRARKRAAGGRFTGEQFKALCRHYGNRCLLCGETGGKLTPDHVVPLARGGSNGIENIQPLCASCNNRKKTRIIDYRPDKGARFAPQQAALFDA